MRCPSLRASLFRVGVVLLLAAVGAPPGQAKAQRVLTPSQRRIVDRIRELRGEIEELLTRLPADLQTELRQELARSPVTVSGGVPVGPERPRDEEARIARDRAPADLAVGGASEFVVLDLRGDGIDLGGRASYRAGGAEVESNWTRQGSDDAFLAIDAEVLRAAGFDLADAGGHRVRGRFLASNRVQLRDPDGRRVGASDPWQLLAHFDEDGDGRVSAGDACWGALLLFVDADGDGTMDPAEVTAIGVSVRSLSLRVGESTIDTLGNELVPGTFRETDGATRTVASVRLRR